MNRALCSVPGLAQMEEETTESQVGKLASSKSNGARTSSSA
jgi:hypothetical protein